MVDVIERRGAWIIPALLAGAAAIAFWPVLGNEFVASWDDATNLLDNPYYRGFGWSQLYWMFTTFTAGHYMPMTWLTLALDYEFWGMSPLGYHLTNFCLHIANSMLVYAIALRLLASGGRRDARIGAAVAAMLFAMHPLRVESVAWASERRDVLCGFFYLAAVLAYLLASAGREPPSQLRRGWYMGSVVLAALALLSKSMAVSLPLVLLVLDVYPMRRLYRTPRGWLGREVRRVWAEKLPFVGLSGAASITALVALGHIHGIEPLGRFTVLDRLAIACYGLAFYLWKMLNPANLSPLYELPQRIDPLGAPFVVSALTVLALSAGAVALRRRWPGLLAVWVSYVAMLLPVLGLVQNGWQIAADRYTYLPSVGWTLLAGAGVAAWHGVGREQVARRRMVTLAAMAVATVLGAMTWQQARAWHDAKSLWTHAIATYPSGIAHFHLGTTLAREGERAGAIEQFRLAVGLAPGHADSHYNLGVMLEQQGQLAEAARQYHAVVKIDPDDTGARERFAWTLAWLGCMDEARAQLHEVVRRHPDDERARHTLERVGDALNRWTAGTQCLEYRDDRRVAG